MVEPGTAAVAVLSTIAGISGYGAMKLNSKQDQMIEAKVNERIRDVKDLLKATEKAKGIAESELKKQETEVERLTKELESIRKAKQGLETLTEGERLFKSVKLDVLKEAVKDFRKRPQVVSFQDGLTREQKDATNKIFDVVEALSMVSLTRGTLFKLHQDLSKAAGKEFMPRVEFDALFVESLKKVQAPGYVAPVEPEPVVPSEPASVEPEPVVPSEPASVATTTSEPEPVVPSEPVTPTTSEPEYTKLQPIPPPSIPSKKDFSEPESEKVAFSPTSLTDRLKEAREKVKQGESKSSLTEKIKQASDEAKQDVKEFADIPLLSATVPKPSSTKPPVPPKSTRRRKFAEVPTPYLKKGQKKTGGTRLTRKKKLRTRREGKQKNVGRSRSR